MDILLRIKELQSQRGWSNYKLAKEAGVHEGSLNNMYRLKTIPTIPTLELLCTGFGITLSQFFTQREEAVYLTSEQNEFLMLWDTLSKDKKAALMELLRAM